MNFLDNNINFSIIYTPETESLQMIPEYKEEINKEEEKEKNLIKEKQNLISKYNKEIDVLKNNINCYEGFINSDYQSNKGIDDKLKYIEENKNEISLIWDEHKLIYKNLIDQLEILRNIKFLSITYNSINLKLVRYIHDMGIDLNLRDDYLNKYNLERLREIDSLVNKLVKELASFIDIDGIYECNKTELEVYKTHYNIPIERSEMINIRMKLLEEQKKNIENLRKTALLIEKEKLMKDKGLINEIINLLENRLVEVLNNSNKENYIIAKSLNKEQNLISIKESENKIKENQEEIKGKQVIIGTIKKEIELIKENRNMEKENLKIKEDIIESFDFTIIYKIVHGFLIIFILIITSILKYILNYIINKYILNYIINKFKLKFFFKLIHFILIFLVVINC